MEGYGIIWKLNKGEIEVQMKQKPIQVVIKINFLKGANWASLVAQWLRICLPMQGTWVRALVWEDPTCRGATKPMSHSC